MNAHLPSSAKLDATFAALADPTRRAIVARLANGEATVLLPSVRNRGNLNSPTAA